MCFLEDNYQHFGGMCCRHPQNESEHSFHILTTQKTVSLVTIARILNLLREEVGSYHSEDWLADPPLPAVLGHFVRKITFDKGIK